MRLEALRIRGIGPFAEEQHLDLSAIEGDVIAITGSNGSGKSTLSEIWPLAMYRDGPTRGKLASLATSRAAFVEATVHTGRERYTIRQEVDAVSGKGEALVTCDGNPVLGDTKVSTFDDWATSHLPSPEVFFASQFGAQGSVGLLSLDKGARKAVVLRALGIDHLEGLAAQCRERARFWSEEVNTLKRFVADAESRHATSPGAIRATLDSLDIRANANLSNLAAAEQDLEYARKADRESAPAWHEYRATMADRDAFADNLRRAENKLRETEERIANNQAVMDDASEIQAAAMRIDVLRVNLTGAQSDLDMARAHEADASTRLVLADQAIDATRQRLTDLARRIEASGDLAGQIATVEAAEARLVELSWLDSSAAAGEGKMRELLAEAQEALSEDSGSRIDDLRDVLTDIASGCVAPQVTAANAIQRDDARVAGKTECLDSLKVLEAMLSEISANRYSLGIEVRQCQRVAALRAGVDAQALSREDDIKKHEAAKDEIDSALARQTALSTDLQICREETNRRKAAVAAVSSEIETLAPVAARMLVLASAEARIVNLEIERDAALVRIREYGVLLGLPPPPEPSPTPDPAPMIGAVDSARAKVNQDIADRARLEVSLAQAVEAERSLAGKRAALEPAYAELADWTRLAADLGRDGLQAVEIDAAGPAITSMANDLLHQAFGPRFTVSFETTRPSSDGKREIEDFRVSVLDTSNGREADAKTFSGGERVILSEAISLALTMLACQRSGVDRPTIIRDESGAALDAANGQRYVAMLRRAARIVGADKVLFISHDPATWDLADARIVVFGGEVSVE